MTLDVLTVGEALVSLRPEGPTATSNTVPLSIAGAETNVAIALARLGHSTAWVGVAGEDHLGALVLRTLRAEGVDVGSARTCEAPTGLILFEQSLPGVTTVDYFRKGSAGSTLTVDDVQSALLRRPRAVHVT